MFIPHKLSCLSSSKAIEEDEKDNENASQSSSTISGSSSRSETNENSEYDNENEKIRTPTIQSNKYDPVEDEVQTDKAPKGATIRRKSLRRTGLRRTGSHPAPKLKPVQR